MNSSQRISQFVYNALLLAASPILLLYLAQRFLSGKSRLGWRERWGEIPVLFNRHAHSKPRIWIHAVSAGEVVAAVPIIRELRALAPGFDLFLSVITPAGHEIATQQTSGLVDGIFFLPFDLPWVVGSVVKKIRPELFISLESELWPNLLQELKSIGAMTAMANGRISERSFERSSRYASWLFKWMLSNMDRALVQSSADAERIGQLAGGFADPLRVQVVGNSKFDQAITLLSPEEVGNLKLRMGFQDSSPIFIAGSVRSPEEEQIVLLAYIEMRNRFPDLCLLIAPRQIERAEELWKTMKSLGLNPVRRTQLVAKDSEFVRHLILDTIGELADLYSIATFAFVGNSFEPVVKGGGQNLIQPLAHGKPVLFGPRHATIRSEVALVLDAGVGFLVKDGKALAKEGIRLLEGEEKRNEIGRRALELIASNRGVSKKYAALAVELLPKTTAIRSETS